MMLAREPAASKLEKGREFGAADRGLLRMIRGDDIEGSDGTGLLSRCAGSRESGLSFAVVA
jgi:hypothetical protein